MMIAVLPLLLSPLPIPIPGTYTNEEEVYFDGEAKRPPAPWVGIVVAAGGNLTFIDRFGRPVAARPYKVARATTPDRATMVLADGREIELRRARPTTCWGASLKTAKKADGSEDWHGARDLKLHDQGGRVSFGGGDSGAPAATLRMRNVVWPSGPSRPSLVLYIHTANGGELAVGYSWADKDAKTVGINLRWMQASCTIDETN